MIEMVLEPETNKYKFYLTTKIIMNFKITILIDIELPQILKNQNKF